MRGVVIESLLFVAEQQRPKNNVSRGGRRATRETPFVRGLFISVVRTPSSRFLPRSPRTSLDATARAYNNPCSSLLLGERPAHNHLSQASHEAAHPTAVQKRLPTGASRRGRDQN